MREKYTQKVVVRNKSPAKVTNSPSYTMIAIIVIIK